MPETVTGTSTDLPGERRARAIALPSATGRTRPDRETSATSAESLVSTIRVTSIRLARVELAGDEELGVGEPARELDRRRAGPSRPTSVAPVGSVSVSTASSDFGVTAVADALAGRLAAGSTAAGANSLIDRAGLGVDQPDDPVGRRRRRAPCRRAGRPRRRRRPWAARPWRSA